MIGPVITLLLSRNNPKQGQAKRAALRSFTALSLKPLARFADSPADAAVEELAAAGPRGHLFALSCLSRNNSHSWHEIAFGLHEARHCSTTVTRRESRNGLLRTLGNHSKNLASIARRKVRTCYVTTVTSVIVVCYVTTAEHLATNFGPSKHVVPQSSLLRDNAPRLARGQGPATRQIDQKSAKSLMHRVISKKTRAQSFTMTNIRSSP